ncbi:MAG TPA: Stp1/IreP family PP2C-type Ser/Thr phosphatase [Firmicutes bacterium]|nr:Stp1/IreP family PP2C-type Ser/Thr phosphatase [Bacillota bacterium]
MRSCGITDIGKVRKENQDSFVIERVAGYTLGVVCDGMGGARSGNVASALAAECFTGHIADRISAGDMLPLPELVREAAIYANVKVYDRAFTDFTCEGMGTTLVGGVFTDSGAIIANIGDSRAYMISRGVIWQISTDHSYVEELVQKGIITRKEAKTHPRRNYITRALGIGREVECDVYEADAEKGNIILLCSDGLSNMLGDDEMLAAAKEDPSPDGLCKKLMDLALSREATDNITVAAFEF